MQTDRRSLVEAIRNELTPGLAPEHAYALIATTLLALEQFAAATTAAELYREEVGTTAGIVRHGRRYTVTVHVRE